MFRRNTNGIPQSNRKKLLLLLSIVLVVILAAVYMLFFRDNSSNNSQTPAVKSAEVKSSQQIDREFSYPIKDSAGEEVSQLTFGVTSAEIRDSVVVKGKRVSAAEGRTFLIFNLRIKNEYSKSIEINTRDYLRLAVKNNESEWLAPEVHNDPVQVQAISTKLTRVGFPVDKGVKEFILQIGEIKGDKEVIELRLD